MHKRGRFNCATYEAVSNFIALSGCAQLSVVLWRVLIAPLSPRKQELCVVIKEKAKPDEIIFKILQKACKWAQIDYETEIGLSPEAADTSSQIHTLLSIDRSVCMWNGYVGSFAPVAHNLLFSMGACVFPACVRSRHSSSRNLRRCDLRDTGFGSFWGLRGAEVSEFQFPPNSHSQSHTLTLCISLTQHNTLCSEVWSSRACFFLFFFYPKHCLSFSLRSIHKVPQGEILSHCTVMPPPPPSLRQTKHSLFLFTLSFQANSEERKRGRNRGESLRIAGPSYFPEMLQPIPKLWANEGGSFTTHALLLQ